MRVREARIGSIAQSLDEARRVRPGFVPRTPWSIGKIENYMPNSTNNDGATQPIQGSANTANTATWEPPIPLRGFDPPPFPSETLSPWMRDFVEAEAVATQTPPDLAGSLALAAVAAAVARRIAVQLDPKWKEPLNIYTVCVLPSGARKSAVFRDVVNPIEEVEEIAVEAARNRVAVAKEEQEQLKRELRDARKQMTAGDGDAEATYDLAARLAAHDIPEPPRLIVDDVTSEQLEVLLERHGGRMAVFAAEGDVFDLIAGRYSKSGMPNMGVFLKAHAGDTIRVDRVGRTAVMVRDPALTMGLAVQPIVIDGLAARKEFRGRGLTPRFLYSLPESNIGRREINPPSMTHQVRAGYEANLTALFDGDASSGGDGVETPRVLTLDGAAKMVLDGFRAEIEPKLGPAGDLSDMAEWGSKLPGAVARIAGLLHIADHSTDPASWTTPVSTDVMMRAIMLGRYFVPHARAAFALMGADPTMADATYLLDWLVSRQTTSISKRDLFDATKGRFKRVKNLDAGLVILAEHDYIRQRAQPHRSGPGRKPSPEFDVNPFAWSQNSHNPQNR